MKLVERVHRLIPYLWIVLLLPLVLRWYLGDHRLLMWGPVLAIAYLMLYFQLLWYSMYKENEMTWGGLVVMVGLTSLILAAFIIVFVATGVL